MALLKRILRALPMLAASPFLVALAAMTLAATDLAWLLFGRRKAWAAEARPVPTAASDRHPQLERQRPARKIPAFGS